MKCRKAPESIPLRPKCSKKGKPREGGLIQLGAIQTGYDCLRRGPAEILTEQQWIGPQYRGPS